MPFDFGSLPQGLSVPSRIRPLPLGRLLGLLVAVVFSLGNAPHQAAANERVQSSIVLTLPAETPVHGRADYIIELEGEPAAAYYAALLAAEPEGEVQAAAVTALTQAHLATIDQAQLQLVEALAGYDADILYRVQRVFNGVAIHAPVDQVAEIAALPGVKGIFPLIPKEPTNSRTTQFLHAPEIWQETGSAGLTGKGIRIAIIDTGIDYLHTNFGGPGTGYTTNNTNIIGDAPNFPGPKIIGGFDFAGDSYDASPTSVNYQPVPAPDPDPMDCYGFGHGTHVAGTAAGYGVRSDGTTYRGPYDSTIVNTSLRIGPGLAPEASIYALKVFGCSGSSNVVDAAIEWAVDPNQDGDFSDRVDVINLSLGSSFGSSFDATTVAVENAAKLGIIVVTSAGNTGDVHYAVGSPGMAKGAIAVAATSVDTSDPENHKDGAVAAFSARGPRRGDHTLKPDIAAPGSNIFSSRRATGSQGVSSSGTSMASPAVAGIMALLRQAYPESGNPGWRNQELKALVMNTAAYPFVRQDMAQPYSLLRVGAGRIDPITALQSRLIAYDAAAPDQVSVSFGIIEVLDHTTAVRAIRLANKSTSPISVTVGYTPVRELPGVTIDVGAGKVITVPALGIATTQVTITANAAEMARSADPTRQIVPANAYPWLDEASGYVSFTPVITTSGPAIHLPIIALPRIISAFSAQSVPVDLGTAPASTFPLTITGSAITTAITNTGTPTHSVPLVGLFGLAYSSPPINKLPNGTPLLGRFAQADLRYVGTAGPVEVDGEPMLYFALVSYGPWATPLEVTYHIAIDINNDDFADYVLQNREATDISTFDFTTTDEFVSLLEPVGTIRIVQGPLNIYPPTEYDTRPFANNVMILPLRLNDLAGDVSVFRYQIYSTSRDLLDKREAEFFETTPVLFLDLEHGAGIVTDRTTPLFPAAAGDVIPVTFHRAAYVQQRTQGLLLLYLHNELSTRTQVLSVEHDWLLHQYLPGIRNNQP